MFQFQPLDELLHATIKSNSEINFKMFLIESYAALYKK